MPTCDVSERCTGVGRYRIESGSGTQDDPYTHHAYSCYQHLSVAMRQVPAGRFWRTDYIRVA